MPSLHHPRRPRASSLWQIVRCVWEEFLAGYEEHYRPAMGPLRPETVVHVEDFLRCGDLAAGFTRFLCPDCGHQHLLAFTCKSRHFCPACHQRRTLRTGAWIANSVCHPVPHRQFVFTIPRMLRGIFRKRRHLLHLLFNTATATLRDAFRIRLNLPDGRIAAAPAVHTFGDYLLFHPHLHILAADGLFDKEGRFHCMPAADLGPMTELFSHRFLQILREGKHLSARKVADLLSWKHSGFHIDSGGEKPVAPHDTDGRKRLAEYLLRAPFSLQKITWNPDTKTVIYRSRRSWHTKRNFEVFKATDFLAAAIEHLPPKGQQTIRYYGLYSNKSRGIAKPAAAIVQPPPEKTSEQAQPEQIPLIPAPPKTTARAMRPLWRDLILSVWGADPLKCPCCRGTIRRFETIVRPEDVEFFLRLLGLWEGLISLPPPPDPPFDIETFEPIEPPWQAIRAWIPADDDESETATPELWDQSTGTAWKAPEIDLGDGRTLVLEYT